MSMLNIGKLLSNSKHLCIPSRICGRYFSSNDSANIPDFYSILGLKSSSTTAEIKKAYYDLTFKYHPDRNKGSEDAALNFRKVTEAYEILGNYSLRKRYDRGLPLPMDERRQAPERVIVEPKVEYQEFFDARSRRHEKPRSGFSFKEFDLHDVNQMDGKRIPPGLEHCAEEFERSQKQQWVMVCYLLVWMFIAKLWKNQVYKHDFDKLE